jgi:hypothetical protein
MLVYFTVLCLWGKNDQKNITSKVANDLISWFFIQKKLNHENLEKEALKTLKKKYLFGIVVPYVLSVIITAETTIAIGISSLIILNFISLIFLKNEEALIEDIERG